MFWGSKRRVKEHLRRQAIKIRVCTHHPTPEEEEACERDDSEGRKGGRQFSSRITMARDGTAGDHIKKEDASPYPPRYVKQQPTLSAHHVAAAAPQQLQGGRVKLTATFSRGAMTGGAQSACALAPPMHANALAGQHSHWQAAPALHTGPVRTRALPAPLMVASPAATHVHCEQRVGGPGMGMSGVGLVQPQAGLSPHPEGTSVCAQKGIAHGGKKRKVGGNGEREKRTASSDNVFLKAKVEERTPRG